MNPLKSIVGSIVVGVIIAFLIAWGMEGGLQFYLPTFVRWLHIIFGITWIGLLYYFNVVQTPALARAAADKGGPGGAGVTKYVAPLALAWFRWSALATWLAGLWYLSVWSSGAVASAITLGHGGKDHYGLVIGTGGWLGTIMLFNVWALIWPAQKKILGIVPANDEQKAKARTVALMASRTNFVLSIPMILCMASAQHGLPF